MHLLLSGSGFFGVGRIVPRLPENQRRRSSPPVRRSPAGGVESGSGVDEVQLGQFENRANGPAQILGGGGPSEKPPVGHLPEPERRHACEGERWLMAPLSFGQRARMSAIRRAPRRQTHRIQSSPPADLCRCLTAAEKRYKLGGSIEVESRLDGAGSLLEPKLEITPPAAMGFPVLRRSDSGSDILTNPGSRSATIRKGRW